MSQALQAFQRETGTFLDGYRTEEGILRMHGTKKSKHQTKQAILIRIKKDAAKISRYRRLSNEVLSRKEAHKYDDESFKLTTQLLDWNPEFYTIWNYRRDILTNFKFLAVSDSEEKHHLLVKELQYILLKLKSFPKCYWIWNHRKWCLKQDCRADFSVEMHFIGQFFEVDPRNYHAWGYRQFIVQCMKDSMGLEGERPKIDYQEFKFTTKMINKNISNYSAFHNRSNLVGKLFDQSPNCTDINETDVNLQRYLSAFSGKSKKQVLELELNMFQNAIYTDPDDSSVWIYARWLFGDYFLDDLTFNEGVTLINKANKIIEELAELEKEDNRGIDNQWCLKTQLYLLKQLYKLYKAEDDSGVNYPEDDAREFDKMRNRLLELDLMRAQRYKNLSLDN
ncbi:hypothetical protein FOA43_004403 [Brettanomyces nanus]|uniref:Geranylgeranyl transferase type-2 subunit alpha n=1 Tax=Eeniella nana TaxID=13502 RepID=A0A875S7T3_EENNA|nr:uncharacterized protein FOA43_004403 [Brettanomyces nanus]QPG77008.1 hypothetical protein FOA43_004403 [Brettanomyces nanus]